MYDYYVDPSGNDKCEATTVNAQEARNGNTFQTQVEGGSKARQSGSTSKGISDYKEYDIVPYDNRNYRTPGFEKHHGVLNEWAEHNIPGYTKKNAPTILLYPETHGSTKTVYQEWLRANYGKPVGISSDWSNVSKAEAMKLTNDMFDAANVPQNVRMEYFELFDIFITGG